MWFEFVIYETKQTFPTEVHQIKKSWQEQREQVVEATGKAIPIREETKDKKQWYKLRGRRQRAVHWKT